MRAKKPTIAGLKRELASMTNEFEEAGGEIRRLRREAEIADKRYEEAQDRCGDLRSAVGWYEREREQTLCWFQESLRLIAPHLVPNEHTYSIDLAGKDPTERMLIETRQRLMRYYSQHGHVLHRSMDTPY